MPRPALPFLELDEGGQSGFMSTSWSLTREAEEVWIGGEWLGFGIGGLERCTWRQRRGKEVVRARVKGPNMAREGG